MFSKISAISVFISVSAFFLVACNDNPKRTVLIDEYKVHADAAMNQIEEADSIDEIDSALSEHLIDMTGIRERMHNQCYDTDECPTGAGLDGEYDNGCLVNGEILAADDMMVMESHENQLMELMHDDGESCVATGMDVADCTQQRKEAILEELETLSAEVGMMSTMSMSPMNHESGDMEMNAQGVCVIKIDPEG